MCVGPSGHEDVRAGTELTGLTTPRARPTQKITATNTWNFALIDYFADMTLLRNGPNDQSALASFLLLAPLSH